MPPIPHKVSIDNPAREDARRVRVGRLGHDEDIGMHEDVEGDGHGGVIDNHDEMLFIFEIPQANDKRVVLKSGTSLPGLFAAARGANTP